MAKQKKTVRRVPRSATPRTFDDNQPVATASVDTAEVIAPRASGTAATRPAAGFRRRLQSSSESRPMQPLRVEYAYVTRDLSRLGVLAGAMVVLMIVLGLIIH